MFKRIRGCFRTIRNRFRRKNKVHPLISDDTEPMNYNVPTPEQLFQVAQREYPEAPVHREEENEKEIETRVEIEEIVQKVEIETEDCESSFSDPIQMTPSPGAILIVVQEAKIRLEYTAEIAPAASLAEDYADLWKRPECHQIEGNDLMDDSVEPVMIDPSPGAMLIVVQEAKSEELKPLFFGEGFLTTSLGSDSTSLETEESHTGSVNILKIEYASEVSENSDLLPEDPSEESHTGSVNILKIEYASEVSENSDLLPEDPSEESHTGSVNILKIEYASEVSENPSDLLPEDPSEESHTGSVNILKIEYASEVSENPSDLLPEDPSEKTGSVNILKIEHPPEGSGSTVDSIAEFLQKDLILSGNKSAAGSSSPEQESPPECHARAIIRGRGFVRSVRRRRISEMVQIQPDIRNPINVPQAPPNSFILARPAQMEVLAERAVIGGACANQKRPSSFRQNSLISTDDFEFFRWLGSGSFGQVYQAEHKKTGKMVAIKRMDKEHYFENGITERVFREKYILRLARNSRNPFLVSLFCAFQSEHHVYIAMEFAAGGSLWTQLKRGALPHESTMFYSACIVMGIKFLHENQIVHRDLKPENVVIDSAGYAKLADFGVCRTGIDDRSQMTYPCGTKFYCAPELLHGRLYNRTVDWWALGVTIYEMAVGMMPFSGNDAELRQQVLYKEPSYPYLLNKNTTAIIRELLQKDPRCRLGSATNDGEEVQKFCYFEPMNWKALQDRQLQAPFIPEQGAKPTEEEQSGGGAETPPNWTWQVDHAVHWAFRQFEELPEK